MSCLNIDCYGSAGYSDLHQDLDLHATVGIASIALLQLQASLVKPELGFFSVWRVCSLYVYMGFLQVLQCPLKRLSL